MEQITQFAPFLLMFVVVYFFMIRPQQKRQKLEKKFENDLKIGDKIITKSGLHGKIAEVNEGTGTIVIETMAGKLKMERSAISMEMSIRLSSSPSVKK